jgi:hypothetical protein
MPIQLINESQQLPRGGKMKLIKLIGKSSVALPIYVAAGVPYFERGHDRGPLVILPQHVKAN